MRFKSHLILSAGFCRKVTDWSIYDTLVLIPYAPPNVVFLDLTCCDY